MVIESTPVICKNSLIKDILKTRYEKISTRNPRYSLRKLAKELEISSGSLTDFLNGKRVFSLKVLIKIINKIKLTEKELSQFNDLPLEPIKEFSGHNISVQFNLSEEGRLKSRKLRQDFIKKLSRLETIFVGNKKETISIIESD